MRVDGRLANNELLLNLWPCGPGACRWMNPFSSQRVAHNRKCITFKWQAIMRFILLLHRTSKCLIYFLCHENWNGSFMQSSTPCCCINDWSRWSREKLIQSFSKMPLSELQKLLQRCPPGLHWPTRPVCASLWTPALLRRLDPQPAPPHQGPAAAGLPLPSSLAGKAQRLAVMLFPIGGSCTLSALEESDVL